MVSDARWIGPRRTSWRFDIACGVALLAAVSVRRLRLPGRITVAARVAAAVGVVLVLAYTADLIALL